MPSTITSTDFAKLIQSGNPVELLDVRSPSEFRSKHLEVAKNIPLNELDIRQLSNAYSTDKQLFVICQSGQRSLRAAEQLSSAGFTKIACVEGGMEAYSKVDLPVCTGKKSISIERQVRIAAGTLVLMGILLSFVSPWLLGLSAFVGAGLVFAGLTDTCGMGLLLSRMPWNR